MEKGRICQDLDLNSKTDWFLPCKNELIEVYNNLQVNGYGNFQNVNYWSLSEAPTSDTVWSLKFNTGQESMSGTELVFGVRAMRKF